MLPLHHGSRFYTSTADTARFAAQAQSVFLQIKGLFSAHQACAKTALEFCENSYERGPRSLGILPQGSEPPLGAHAGRRGRRAAVHPGAGRAAPWGGRHTPGGRCGFGRQAAPAATPGSAAGGPGPRQPRRGRRPRSAHGGPGGVGEQTLGRGRRDGHRPQRGPDAGGSPGGAEGGPGRRCGPGGGRGGARLPGHRTGGPGQRGRAPARAFPAAAVCPGGPGPARRVPALYAAGAQKLHT